MSEKKYALEFELLSLIVEDVTGVSKETLVSKTRKRPVVELRMICSNILKEHLKKANFVEIGSFLNIDHSTVTYHLQTHPTLMDQKDASYKKKYERINNLYKNRILMTGENLKEKLLNKRKQLEYEIIEINFLLKSLDKTECPA